MQGLLFGLAAAVSWGAADVLAAVVSRRVGVLRPQLAMQALGTLMLAPLLFVVPLEAWFGAGRVVAFVGVGALSAVAFLAFYSALREGPIALVSPIVSAYAAVVLLLAVLFLRERPSPLQLTGIGLTILGVVLASADLRQIRSIRVGRGIWYAFVTLLGFGVVLFFIGQQSRELSWFLPAFLVRALAVPPLVAVSAVRREWPWQAGGGVFVLMALLAASDSLGTLAYGFGTTRGFTSIVATAASAYALIPMAYGVVALRERFAPNQALGVALVLSGLVALGLAA